MSCRTRGLMAAWVAIDNLVEGPGRLQESSSFGPFMNAGGNGVETAITAGVCSTAILTHWRCLGSG